MSENDEGWKRYLVLGIPTVLVAAGTLAVWKVGRYLWDKASAEQKKVIDELMSDESKIANKKVMLLHIAPELGPTAGSAARQLRDIETDGEVSEALEVVEVVSRNGMRK